MEHQEKRPSIQKLFPVSVAAQPRCMGAARQSPSHPVPCILLAHRVLFSLLHQAVEVERKFSCTLGAAGDSLTWSYSHICLTPHRYEVLCLMFENSGHKKDIG